MDREPQLDELYREILIDHGRHPHNFGVLPGANVVGEGQNPICGDELSIALRFTDDRVSEARFRGRGCTISQASASMLTDAVVGRTAGELASLIEAAEAMLRGEALATPQLGDLETLQSVARFPARVKCALLAWKVLRRALAQQAGLPDPEPPTSAGPRPVPGKSAAPRAKRLPTWQPAPRRIGE